jgi:hypothetical protein
MPRFLVEVPQPSNALARRRMKDLVRTMGSHFVTHADWRRRQGVCTGTVIVEADDKSGAVGVVPPGMRSDAHVYRLEAVPQ